MQHSPTTILNFLSSHYTALEHLYRRAKQSNYALSEEDLLHVKQTYGVDRQLLNYKIIRINQQGGYYMEEQYFEFLAFLNQDFSLDLPERIGKYHTSFSKLKERLLLVSPNQVDKVKDICSNLIRELRNFLSHLETHSAGLEQEVSKLRVEKDYTQRLPQVAYLIDHYLKPLNQILALHPDAIKEILNQLRQHAHQRILDLPDTYRNTSYQQLHSHLVTADEQLNIHLSYLVRNLLPLLAQMRVSDQYLEGFKILRDAHANREYERYLDPLPKLISGSKHYTFDHYREGKAQSILSEVGSNLPIILHQQANQVKPWIFRAKEYRQALHRALPMANFFAWCHQTLAEEHPDQPVTSYQLLQVANLLFDRAIRPTFTTKRMQLQLQDRTLHVPQIQVTQTHTAS